MDRTRMIGRAIMGVTYSAVQMIVVSTFSVATAVAEPTDEFVSAGDTSTPRYFHTATRLQDGRVLIAGGASAVYGRPTVVEATAELYDASTGTFVATGRMTSPRWRHTATLLGDGRVLLVGGSVDEGFFSNRGAELYEPLTGEFTPTSHIPTLLFPYRATLLADGRVLVLDAFGVGAELYDPESDTFTRTGDMLSPAVDTATVLANGMVLVTKGFAFLRHAELYDPSTGTFAATGDMVTFHTDPTATLLRDGRVLIVGGGEGDGQSTVAELYDPATGTFSLTGKVSTGRQDHTATLLPDGRVLVSGGYGGMPVAGGGLDNFASAELYDPATGTFRAAATMATGRAFHVATLLANGSVLVTGGVEYYPAGAGNRPFIFGLLASAELYVGATIPGGQPPSPDTTTVPAATQIVDTSGAIWTIGPNLAILRNGVQAAGGWGSQIFWRNHTLYVLGTDNNWYQWMGSSWTFLGPTFPGGQLESLDGTTVPNAIPTATRIFDTSGAIWTIGPNLAILRNGVQAAGGWGSQIFWTSHTLYVLGTDNNWYQWTGSSWTFLGPAFPGASLDGTTVPQATQIVDTSRAIWTIGPNLAILRNGRQAAGGWGSQIVWTSHTLYVLGTDNNWYQWTGSSWAFLGLTFPGASPDGTTVPHATQIVDHNGAIWTIGPNLAILRNGAQAAGGWGSQMVWASHTLYVLGTDNNWYQWTGSSWTFLGATFPGVP